MLRNIITSQYIRFVCEQVFFQQKHARLEPQCDFSKDRTNTKQHDHVDREPQGGAMAASVHEHVDREPQDGAMAASVLIQAVGAMPGDGRQERIRARRKLMLPNFVAFTCRDLVLACLMLRSLKSIPFLGLSPHIPPPPPPTPHPVLTELVSLARRSQVFPRL